MIIGIDFDNTIADYDCLFAELAAEAGVAAPDGTAKRESRMELRRRLRGSGEAGEIAWQELQASAYGPRMGGARVFDGVPAFLSRAHASGAKIYVISHKTRYALRDIEERCDMREASLSWMKEQGLFGGGALAPADVFFHDSREEKVARIAELGCTHFIDDLEEVFNQPEFPADVAGYLLAADGRTPHLKTAGCRVAVHHSWPSIHRDVFG
jgi:hypothetical protein